MKKIALLLGLTALSSSAFAAIPTEATDAITGISTDVATLMTSAWPVVVAVTGGFIAIKLVKRAMRASS